MKSGAGEEIGACLRPWVGPCPRSRKKGKHGEDEAMITATRWHGMRRRGRGAGLFGFVREVGGEGGERAQLFCGVGILSGVFLVESSDSILFFWIVHAGEGSPVASELTITTTTVAAHSPLIVEIIILFAI